MKQFIVIDKLLTVKGARFLKMLRTAAIIVVPETNFIFNILQPGKVSLKIYDVLGNEIAILVNKELPPGEYRMLFNTARFNLPSGVYYYKLESGSYSETRKMVLLK